jgi:hypothetical protein
MTINVEQIAEKVKALSENELDEFLSWLADYEVDRPVTPDFRMLSTNHYPLTPPPWPKPEH